MTKFNIWRMGAIAAVTILIITVWYFREVNESVKRNNELLKSERAVLEKKVNEAVLQKKAIESELSSSKKERALLAERVNKHENEKEALNAELEKLKASMAKLNNNIAEKNAEISKLLRELEGYASGVGRQAERAAAAAGGDTIELSPITVELAPEKPKLNARVIDVNREYNFLVMSAGRNQGVKKDDALYVLRGRTMLGRVVVEKVGANVSVGKPLYKSLKDAVEKGDRVSF